MTEKVSIQFTLSSELRQVGDTLLPCEFTARWESPDDHTVELDIRVQPVDVGGTKATRPFCQAIRIERNPNRPPLDSTELRRLPLTRRIELACTEAAMRQAYVGTGPWHLADSDDERRAALQDVRESQRRRRITDELLRQVAAVYEEADGDMEIVRQRMYVSKAQAYRYVREAKKRSFLAGGQA